MCFDVSMPIRLICSTDGSFGLRIYSDLILARLMPSGAVHTNRTSTYAAHVFDSALGQWQNRAGPAQLARDNPVYRLLLAMGRIAN
jgi:hypothetical protein